MADSMNRDVQVGCMFEDGLEAAGAFRARNLDAVVRSVRKALLRAGEVMKVTRRKTGALEEATDGVPHAPRSLYARKRRTAQGSTLGGRKRTTLLPGKSAPRSARSSTG